jgi:hypothetical protein
MSRWVRTRLFRSYLRAFVLLWLGTRMAMVAGALLAGTPPFSLHPIGEALACVIELWVLALFLKSSHEDILLGNIGLSLGDALMPLVVVHVVLSAALVLLA